MICAAADPIFARARAAQRPWASLPAGRRCKILANMRREMARRCEEIASIVARETNKPLLDALSGDLLVTLEHLRYCQSQAPRALRARRIPRSRLFFAGTRFQEYREPHGVVLIFAPSNYPLQLSLVPASTALAAGNAVVLKCSERTPETAALIESLCATAALPADLMQVRSDAPESATALIHAGPDFIFFTGSTHNGNQVALQAAQHLIPGVFELGGKDPALVFADCDLDRTVDGVAYGAFCNAGRVCVGVRRVYVEAPAYSEFIARLRQRIARLRVGHVGQDEESDLCPLPAASLPALRTQIHDALSRGAALLWPPDSRDAGQLPTLLADVPAGAMLLTEESFGPVLCVAPFHSEDEAVALANASPFALGSSIWTRDRGRAARVSTQLNGGACSVNDVIRNVGNPWAAFGGNRQSGYGRYRGMEGFRAFTRAKTVMLGGRRRSRPIHWFPWRSATAKRLATLLRLRHASNGFAERIARVLPPVLLVVLLAAGFARPGTAETQLSIQVRLTPRAHGDLGYLIFAAPAGFPGDRNRALRHGFLPIPAGAGQMTINATLPQGTYAVSVYEDLNRNHQLDHNFLGIPREPVGVSGSPRSRYGPPHFDECSFRVGDKAQTITITVVHGL